tara:strand:+ start:529 stop:729 length:201 start_codon:yes stop_codon:yes gene_type:complete
MDMQEIIDNLQNDIRNEALALERYELIEFLLVNKGLVLNNYMRYVRYTREELIDRYCECKFEMFNL